MTEQDDKTLIKLLRKCHDRRQVLENGLAEVSKGWDEMASLSMRQGPREAPLHIMGLPEDVITFRAAAQRVSSVLQGLNVSRPKGDPNGDAV